MRALVVFESVFGNPSAATSDTRVRTPRRMRLRAVVPAESVWVEDVDEARPRRR